MLWDDKATDLLSPWDMEPVPPPPPVAVETDQASTPAEVEMEIGADNGSMGSNSASMEEGGVAAEGSQGSESPSVAMAREKDSMAKEGSVVTDGSGSEDGKRVDSECK